MCNSKEMRAEQSMEWIGSIRWIHNPVQSRRIWIGLDQKFTNSADPGLDWIQKCAMYIPYLDLRQFLLIVTLMTSEVLPSNLQLFTSPFVFTCRFYKIFGRYLLCCVRIGLNWIQMLVLQLDWTGLGSVARGFGLDWIVSTGSIPYSGAETRHCNFVAGHSVYTLETITSMVLLYGEPVCAPQTEILFFKLFWKNGKHISRAG